MFEKLGPSSLLSIHQNRYENALSLRKCSTGVDSIGDYLNIGFQNAVLQRKALRKEFIVQNQKIQAIMPIGRPFICASRMGVSGLPSDFNEDSHIWIEQNFRKFSQVLKYCLYHTKDGNCFIGNAYVILAINEPYKNKYGTITTEHYD